MSLSLSLALLNSLNLLNSEKKNVNKNVLIPPKNIYIKRIRKFAPKFGAFSNKGALGNGLIGLSLGPALYSTEQIYFCKYINKLRGGLDTRCVCVSAFPAFSALFFSPAAALISGDNDYCSCTVHEQ